MSALTHLLRRQIEQVCDVQLIRRNKTDLPTDDLKSQVAESSEAHPISGDDVRDRHRRCDEVQDRLRTDLLSRLVGKDEVVVDCDVHRTRIVRHVYATTSTLSSR